MIDKYPMLPVGVMLPTMPDYKVNYIMIDNIPFKDTMQIICEINGGRSSTHFLLMQSQDTRDFYFASAAIIWNNYKRISKEGKITATWYVKLTSGGRYILTTETPKPKKAICERCGKRLKLYSLVSKEPLTDRSHKQYWSDQYDTWVYGCKHCQTVERD
jgi:hypothetical protein